MKKVNFFMFYLIISYVGLISSHAFAQKILPEDLSLRIHNYVYDIYSQENTNELTKIQVSQPKIDSRLQMNECSSEIELKLLKSNNNRHVNVKVSCLHPTPWQIYVPLKVAKLSPVLVSASNLSKGTLLDTSNTKVSYIPEHKIRGATLASNENIIGTKLKRNMQKDNAIYHSYLCTVCKGDMVTIIADSPVFNIKTEGTALTSGNQGEQVSVRNNRSGKVISARVNSVNKVVINL